jgi:hypothetical protein
MIKDLLGSSMNKDQRLSRARIVPSTKFLFFMTIGNPRWLPPQVIVLTQDHMGKIQKYVLEAIAVIVKSPYRSPGYKKNQLVQCKNYVIVLQW